MRKLLPIAQRLDSVWGNVMDEYTPTTKEVRDIYAYNGYSEDVYKLRFDRWLAAAQSEAFEKGVQAGLQQCDDEWRDRKRIRDAKNPYIEKSA